MPRTSSALLLLLLHPQLLELLFELTLFNKSWSEAFAVLFVVVRLELFSKISAMALHKQLLEVLWLLPSSQILETKKAVIKAKIVYTNETIPEVFLEISKKITAKKLQIL